MTLPVTTTRRKFLQTCGWTSLALPLFGQRVIGANDTVRVGMISCGSRAGGLASQFARLKNVTVAAVCDPDSQRVDHLAAELVKKNQGAPAPAKFRDYRKMLESKDIDAVVVATPNHWHTLHAIHAMQAGKDVYLEKPVTHNLWEGIQLVAAEKRYGRMLACGFQSRSDPGPAAGFEFVRAGKLGKILSVHICCFKDRVGIGKRTTPLAPPDSVDYDLWLGPGEDLPILREKFHYDWHWSWNTGSGETGNQAPHEIDLTNRLLGDGPLPATIRSIGGRFAWDDAGETPNMHITSYELAGVPVMIEVNDLQVTPARKVAPVRNGIRIGLLVQCEGGQLCGGLGGMYAVGEDGTTKIEKFPGNGGAGHAENFIDAVRSRRAESIASRATAAVKAAAIAHLSNVSLRSGAASQAGAEELAGGNAKVKQILEEHAKQLEGFGIKQPTYQSGKQLAVDPATGAITTPGVDPVLIRRRYREKFTVPELG